MKADNLLYRMNKLNSSDAMVKNLMEAIGDSMDAIDAEAEQNLKDLFVTWCSLERLKDYENEANVKASNSQSEEDRRANVMSRWKGSNKCDLALLQSIAEMWKVGETSVEYVGNRIEIKFDDKGIPSDLEGLIAAIEEAKPAHLAAFYMLVYAKTKVLEDDVQWLYKTYDTSKCGTFKCGTKPKQATIGATLSTGVGHAVEQLNEAFETARCATFNCGTR